MQLKYGLFLTAVASASPIAKVLSILGECEQKIIKEGADSQKVYEEFSEWCEDRSRNVGFEIKTGKSQVEELTATIANEKSKQDALTTEIEELAGSIAANDKDLAAATTVRNAEAADFAVAEKELTETIDTIERAIGIIQRELGKGGALVQMKSVNNLAQAFSAMVSASVLSTADADRLTALVQQKQESDDSDMGAPAAEVYENHSGDIVDTLQSLLEKAEAQLDAAMKKETNAKNNYAVLKQSLDDEIKFAGKEKDDATKSLAASSEAQATAEGDLSVTQKDLDEDEDVLSTLHHDCLTGAEDFEAEVKSRAEELKAIAAAKSALKENTGGADELTYSASFLQVDAKVEPTTQVVHFVRNLAKKQSSAALSQLASRISSAVRLSASSGEDPFGKVKALITDMIAKLEEDSKADATHKAYCDKETTETNQKKIEKKAEVEHLSTKIDQKSAASAKLKEETATLQRELAALSASQLEMDQIRAEEKKVFAVNKADMEQGLEGVKMALKVLHDYYAKADKAHSAQGGTSTGVIGMLEVVESDFSKGLAEMIAVEDQSEASYVMESKKNEVTKAMKDQDVKYKTKEAAGLDKAVTELSSDRDGAQDELDAVLEYLKKLDEMCVAKPESYSERASRRKAEIDGLREALSILESEVAFVQRSALRGVRAHMQ